MIEQLWPGHPALQNFGVEYKMKINSISLENSVSIKCDGYLPVIITFGGNDGPTTWVPEYWRIGDFKRSIVEISICPTTGTICKIVVTLLNKMLTVLPAYECLPAGKGIPNASLSIWQEDKGRIDVNQEVYGCLIDNEFSVLFSNADELRLQKSSCGRVAFLIDDSGILKGFEVGNLSQQDIENIKYATKQPMYPRN